MSQLNKNDMQVLNTLKDGHEEKSLKNLLSRKNLDLNELDQFMNPSDFY